LLDALPVLDALIVGRFALVAAAALGILLAVATDRLLTLPRTGRAAAAAAIVGALVPIAPIPLQVADRRSTRSSTWGGRSPTSTCTRCGPDTGRGRDRTSLAPPPGG
jgi:hypothetical protein